MFNSEKNIYINETEVKPNTNAMIVLLITVVSVIGIMFLNEIEIFHVGKTEMRIGSVLPATVVLIMYLVLKVNEELRSNPKTKYYVITTTFIVCLSVNVLLTFHATLMLLYPLFIAMLYREKRVGYYAIFASLFCTIFSPVISYVLQIWDVPLLTELILIATNETVTVSYDMMGFSWISVVKILLYLSFPKVVIIGACSVLVIYVIKLGEEHVSNQIELYRNSHRDALTGVYNRAYLDELIKSKEYPGKIGVVFFDVNGLKAANDSNGHEYGDMLLQRCSKSLLNICDDDSIAAFRYGGDEFVLLIQDADEAEIEKTLNRWKAEIARINEENVDNYDNLICSMAVGYASGYFKDLEFLLTVADSKMYDDKSSYKKKISAVK